MIGNGLIHFSTVSVVPGETWVGGRLCLVVDYPVDDGQRAKVQMMLLRSVLPCCVEVVLFPEMVHEHRTPMTAI